MVSPRKRSRADYNAAHSGAGGSSDNGEMQADQGLAEAAGLPAGSGDSTNPRYSYISRPDPKTTTIRTFRNVIMANSWGYAYGAIKHLSTENYTNIRTPLACIPVNDLSLYISPAEYEKLAPEARAISCRVKVTPKGFRTSFSTAQTNPTYSNSNHTIFGVHAIGLNKSQFGEHGIYEEQNANPMEPDTKTEVPKDCMRKVCWGPKCGDADFMENLPNCIMVKRSLPIYWNLNVYRKSIDPAKNQICLGWPQLREQITEWDFAGHVNIPVINYQYKFQNGIIKSRKAFWAQRSKNAVDNEAAAYLGNGTHNRFDVQTNKNGELVQVKSATDTLVVKNVEAYDTNIEKPTLTNLFGKMGSCAIQPLIYVGVQPIEANVPKAKGTYTNVQVNWLIELELDVEISEHLPFTESQLVHPWEVNNLGYKSYTVTDVLNLTNTLGVYRKCIQRTIITAIQLCLF